MSLRDQYKCGVPDDQRCEALLMDSWLHPTNHRCRHFATVKLGKQRFCVKHAQMEALAVLIKSREAKPIPRMVRLFKTVAACRVRVVGKDEVMP